ncbi:FadR family transcriptional regulator [Candidatus Bipolaricaulota bacterium]|nr:FadR family transcriptional regulator [Candidatus Bipolaricaulota bacterium]
MDAVMERIIDLVGTGILRTDQKLPSEKELMTAFGVGRSSIREALRALVATNLLETRPGKGYFVSPMAHTLVASGLVGNSPADASNIHEVMEARKILETAIAGLALSRATAEDFERVRRTGQELKDAAGEGSELLPYTMRVHFAIAQSAHNAFLKKLLTDLLRWIMALFTPLEVSPKLDVQMHIQLMTAFLSRDADAFSSALEKHNEFWQTKFVEWYPQGQAGESREGT